MILSLRVAAIASLMAVASTLATAQTTGTLPPQPPPYGVAPSPSPATTGQFSLNELIDAGHRFFGTVSHGLAMVVEKAVSQWGLPNGYVLGQEASGAFIGGLRYGDGTLYTRNAGDVRVFWQGPSVGFDAGADGARTMMLVYNLPQVGAGSVTGRRCISERVPRRAVGELEVAEIGSKPQTDTRADRNHNNMVCRKRRHAETANEVGRTGNAAEAIENRSDLRQVVDQHHRPRTVSAGVETDAWPLPEHAHVTGISCVERAVAIAEATDKGTARLLTQNIAVR